MNDEMILGIFMICAGIVLLIVCQILVSKRKKKYLKEG